MIIITVILAAVVAWFIFSFSESLASQAQNQTEENTSHVEVVWMERHRTPSGYPDVKVIKINIPEDNTTCYVAGNGGIWCKELETDYQKR